MNPVIKWVGGKRQLLPIIKQYIPKKYNTYFEPFVGGGALLFDLQPKEAVINDLNSELMNCYCVIRDLPDKLIYELNYNGYYNTEQDYYRIRGRDRSDKWPYYFQPWERAARTIYLNKNGFNGLYRTNKDGKFNVPYGKHKNEFKPDAENILAVGEYLKNNQIQLLNLDFVQSVKNAKQNDFIYFDPPYDPVSDTANFTAYTKEGFDKLDQVRLRDKIVELTARGCYCMLSNAGTDFIKNLYKDFYIINVQARRSVNCNGDSRGKVSEVLIMNYNNQIQS